MRQNVLVVDNHDSFVYNLVQMLRESGACQFTVVRNDAIDFAALSRFDKLLLSPGPGLPDEAGDLMRLIRMCHATHSILGVCLGHQALGQFFGARLTHIKQPRHGHCSILRDVAADETLYASLASPIRVGRYHSWTLSPDDFPKALRITARDEEGNIMSFAHQSLPLFGVQYHPESIITEQGNRILLNWLRHEHPRNKK